MKLTKKLETEILKLYSKYWDAYLNGKMKTMSSLMDKNCHVIGSGMGEVFKNKKDAVKYYTTTADQIAGVSEMRNRNISVANAGNNILVTEESDFYVLMEGSWAFYGQGRLSTLFSKTEKKWLIIQQHGSLPDSRTGGGEQLNIDKIKEENLRLKEAIKRRTIELENKNRELEVEVSLEKVRAVAMSMNKPEDLLNICEVLYKEFHSFGFSELRNAMINIHNDEKKTFLNYDYSDKIEKSINHLEYNIHPVIKKQIKQIRSADDAFSETVFKGTDLKSWKAFRKKIGEKDDPRINKSTALHYYFYSIGTGSIGISTFSPIDEEKLGLLKRFRNVFKLSYQRYKDIEQAEAQAREAQIEASLERVRSRAMAMHKSDELLEAGELLYREITKLGIECLTSGYVLMDEKENVGWNYAASPADGKIMSVPVGIPHMETEVMRTVTSSWKKGEPYSIIELDPEATIKHQTFIAEHSINFPLSAKELIAISPERVVLHNFNFKQGYLIIVGGKLLTNEQIEMMVRFAKVFEMTYRRFLDLQKAEAQAREAEIELALERVRARTMAMQHSDELAEASFLLDSQVRALGIKTRGCAFNIYGENESTEWFSSEMGTMPVYKTPRENIFLRYYEEGQKGKLMYIESFAGNACAAHYDYLCTLPIIGESLKKIKESGGSFPTQQIDHVTYFKYGYLLFITLEPVPDAHDIFIRFAKVFEQTYTRFLDLQKAEAQAREAQIEAALERVRSRTMGMQKSEELKEVIRVVYEQFVHLKINVDHAGFVVDYTPRGDWHFWIADEQDIPSKITHPYFESVWASQFNEAKEKGADFFATNLNFEEKNKFYNELLSYVPGLPEASKDFYLSCPGLAGSTVLLDNVALYIENFSGIPYTDEDNKTLMRFGKVFQQTYTRFNDLKQAEAQAREAHIEAALEKVRSRSLAMHKSDELQDVVNTVFERLKDLKINMNVASIFIFKDGSKDWEQWVASSTTNYSTYFYIPYMDLSVFRDLEEAKQKRKDFYSVRYSLEQKNEWFSYAFENTEYKQVPDDRKKYILESEFFLVSFALSKHSGIQIAKYEGKDFTEEENEILKRFARVFEQVYIRFLDLQKAEAQARESQVEAALERVRSRTMAMQKSEDLNKAASDMFKQIQVLGMQPWACGFNIFDKDEKDVTQYMSLADAGISPPFRTPLIEDPFFINIYEARQKKEKLLVMESSGESLAETYRYMFGLPGSREIFGDLENSGFEMPKFQITHCAYFSQGYLVFITYEPVPEAHDIFRRFAKVFEQTYTRFLDLQKAEAQARESQIEASLERVRSKAMAMYKSEDLTPAVATVFSELDRLSFRTVRCGIGIFNDLSEKVDVWTTSSNDKSGSVNLSGNEVLEGHPLLEGIFKAWKLQKDYSYVLEGKDLLDYYRVTSNSNLPVTAPEVTSETTKQYYHCIMFPSGGLFAFRESEFSTEAKNLMRRFADVFQLTFTRHLDLRKAEAQNKLIQAENERKTKELEDARQLQLSMLPRELPKVSNLDIAVYMKTATEVGGDYYDFHIQPDGTLNVLVGDATGHGMMSGMMVSIMKSFFIANRNNFELKHFFENSNISIKDMQLGRLMMACIGVQVTSKKVIATNAGMPSLLYFRNKSQKAGEFVINNMPLGAMKGSKYAIKELNYEKGDTLLLMSDGLAELKNQNQEQYGYPRVKKEFKSVVRKSSNEIIDYLKNSASEWANGVEPDDDLTFVVIKVK